MTEQKTYNLTQQWMIAPDPENIGKEQGWETKISEDAVEAYVPSIIQQFFPEHHGVAYYWCKFTPELTVADTDHVQLCFGAIDYKGEVWLNGAYVGSHEGAETPFSLDVTKEVRLGEENLLAVRVINPNENLIDGLNLINTPHRNKIIGKRAGSHLNHGGIWYEVTMAAVPAVYIKEDYLRGDIDTGAFSARTGLYSYEEGPVEATLTVKIMERHFPYGLVASATCETTLEKGDNEVTLDTCVKDPILWSLENPHLYNVELSVTTPYGTYQKVERFGFRRFEVKDGIFHLNNKRIFIKCAHSGNCFPIGEMFAVRPEQMRQDMLYAKSCGFNMVRAISGMFRPQQIDTADEIGLLLYQECFASWCLGYSGYDFWETPEEFEKVNEAHPEMQIPDEKAMLDRFVQCTEEMIKRDRNHASIGAWGMLNETSFNNVFRAARDFLPRARELDPDRLVFLGSGRFDRDFSLGSVSNPGSDTWDLVWGAEGHPELSDPFDFTTDENYAPTPTYTGDNHYYVDTPLSKKNIHKFRTLGSDCDRPIYLSEFGVGSMFHVIEEWKHFKQYGLREDLPDASWVKAQSEAMERDWEKLGLSKIYPFAEMFLKESQRQNGNERKRNIDMIRSNPNLVGYSLTGLLDHGMCGEGLWSYWRRWKPEMFDSISDGWAPLRFCLFATDHSYRGETMEIEAVLANEGILPTGTYTADFAIVGEQGTVMKFTETFSLDGDKFAVPVMKKQITLDVPEGRYQLVASLREGAPHGCVQDFLVCDRALHPNLDGYKVTCVQMPEAAKEVLSGLGATVMEDLAQAEGVILAGEVDTKTMGELFDAAKNGATVMFLAPKNFQPEENQKYLKLLAEDMFLRTNLCDGLYHKETVLADREVFKGLGNGILEAHRFGAAFPHPTFATEKVPAQVMAPSFVTGEPGVEGSYAMGHSLAGFAYEKGKVILNTIGLLDCMGEPASDRLLANLVYTQSK